MSARNDRYDARARDFDRLRPSRDHEERYGHRPSHQNRERSRSPDEEKERVEKERRARMARLRAENEEEEKQLAVLDEPVDNNMLKPKEQFVEVNQEELEGLDEDEQMQRLLGFSGGFATTKGTEVEDNTKSAARGASGKNKARKYRQYMNRKGGFNRPLDKMN